MSTDPHIAGIGNSDQKLQHRISAMSEEQLQQMLQDGVREWAPPALALAKAELEQRRKVLLKPGVMEAGQQSLVADKFRSILRGEATDEDGDYREVEELVIRQTANTASRAAIARALEARGVPSMIAGELIEHVWSSPRAREQISERFRKRAAQGVVIFVVGGLLTLFTSGRFLFVGAVAVGVVWFLVGFIFALKWNSKPELADQSPRCDSAQEK